ncbi:MAG TPA: galactosyltransferase-related protein [Burkholderiales bacterium]|nr:galactosyltransferase-related protein [Burkholderiales bacterium]
MAAELSFVTACKSRLAYLKQTLPLLAQADAETVVVDYGCPQGTRAWVKENFPAVKVVAVDDDPGFCLSRARNLGASAASAARLCFVDADIKIRSGFAPWLRENFRPRHFYRASPCAPDAWGTFACSAEDFHAVGGFDEAMRGWGGEDDDLYLRLENCGCRPSAFPGELVEPIPHHDAERVAQYEMKDRWMHHRVNLIYVYAKIDIARMTGRELNLEERRQLFAEAQKGAAAADSGQVMEIGLAADPRVPMRPDSALERRIVYRFVRRTS